MKKLFFLLTLTFSISTFACNELIGDYVCIDEFSYQYYRNISIQAVDMENISSGVTVLENGRNRYLRTLKLDNIKRGIEDMTIRSSCSGNTLKVTMKHGRFSSTEKFKRTKTGIVFYADEETGRKKLECTKK